MKLKFGKFPKFGSQKIDIQIDSWDTWNLDSTLAKIIYPLLIQLKNTMHGVPGAFIENIGGEDYIDQLSFDFYKETHDESFQQRTKEWNECLDKMIWSFQQIAESDYDSKYHHGQAKYDWVKSDTMIANPITGKTEPTYQMVDKNPDEHWLDIVGLQLHEDRIQEGIDLFAKHFRSLWD